MAGNEKKNIGVFSDGYYLFKIWNHYDSTRKATFNFKKLFGGFIEYEVSTRLEIPMNQCSVTGFHHYAGGSAETDAQQRFEKALVDAGLGMNICRPPLSSTSDGEKKEKGVDGQLMLDAFEAVVMEKRYNVLVLVTGDADFFPLIERIKRKNIPTFLICWNLEVTNTVTSIDLIKIVDYALLMHGILDFKETNNPFVEDLLVENQSQTNSVAPVTKSNLPPGESVKDAISPDKDLRTLLLETAKECGKKDEGWMLAADFGVILKFKGYAPNKENGERLTDILQQRYPDLFEIKTNPASVRLRSQSGIQCSLAPRHSNGYVVLSGNTKGDCHRLEKRDILIPIPKSGKPTKIPARAVGTQ